MDSKGFRLNRAIIYIFLLAMSVVSIFPFYIMVIMSTHLNEELFTGIKLLPGNYLLQNFHTILSTNFLLYYKNSIIVTLSSTIGIVVISTITGFAFAKMRFKGRSVLFYFILGTIMVPSQVGLVGFIIEMKWFGINNTFIPLIVPAMASAFGVFWMKQYISSSVPDELLEAANMDGCGVMRTLISVVVPVIKPALITLFLLFFLWMWNDYLTPLVILNDQKLYTIPLSISIIGQLHRTDYAARILCLTLATIPILTLFASGSKYLIKGMISGSIKG
ncbi:MAG TPA: carbohydrate ABC transporter permease [Ruminiclostridium sp.]